MSDGERVGLYLIAQCLCIPENKTIIIDEPEIHLHRSIMDRLWTAIEAEREDRGSLMQTGRKITQSAKIICL